MESMLRLGEFRIAAEATRLLFYWPQIATHAPEGDGRPVVVIPGFGTGPASTVLLQSMLSTRGYRVYDWEQGVNWGPRDDVEANLAKHIRQVANDCGEKVTLVGWSLGGVFARVMACENPDVVRQVITMGTPYTITENTTTINGMFEKLTGLKIKDLIERDGPRIAALPTCPVTSIYSETDGVVRWQDCLLPNTPITENVCVDGSHTGLTHNVASTWVVLDRLSQIKWKPFQVDDNSFGRRFF